MARWVPKQLATFLTPYLTETAQVAYLGLPNEEAHDNKMIRTAILDALDITPETFWCWFWEKTYLQGARPRVNLKMPAGSDLNLNGTLPLNWMSKWWWSSLYISSYVYEQFIHILQ